MESEGTRAIYSRNELCSRKSTFVRRVEVRYCSSSLFADEIYSNCVINLRIVLLRINMIIMAAILRGSCARTNEVIQVLIIPFAGYILLLYQLQKMRGVSDLKFIYFHQSF